MKQLAILILVIIEIGAFYACYQTGKHAADRWYAEHPPKPAIVEDLSCGKSTWHTNDNGTFSVVFPEGCVFARKVKP